MTEGRAPGRPAGKWLGPEGPGARLLSVMVAIALIVLAAFGLFVFAWMPEEHAGAVKLWQRRLDVVAQDRETEVANWVQGLVANAQTVISFPAVLAAQEEGEDGRGLSPAAGAHLREVLKTFVETENLAGLLVFDGRGRRLAGVSVPDSWKTERSGDWSIPGPERTRAKFVSGPEGPLVAVTVSRATGSAKVVHVVALADPSRWLYPFLARNLVSSQGEAILVHQEDEVSFLLSPSRLHPSKLLEPIAAVDSKRALFATRKVQGTVWTLVVWVDQDEAMAPVRQETWEVALLLVLGALLVLALTVGLYRETRRRFVKRAEASAQRLALLLDAASDAILSVDARGRLVDANWKAEELWGRSREELLSLTIGDLEVSGERPAFDRQIEEVQKSGYRLFETECVRKDGSRVPVEVSASAAPVEGGMGYLAIVRDLSARKEVERRYRLILENSIDVIWTLDIASMRLTYVSPSVMRLRGVTPEEAMSLPVEATMTPGSAVRVRAILEEQLADLARGGAPNASRSLRVEQPRKDGSIVTTEMVATFLMDSKGRPVEVLGVTRDISEQLAAEEEIRRSREALIDTQRIAHVGSWERDLSTGALTWSDEVYRIFGLDPSGPRIDPDQFVSLVHSEDREMVSGLPHRVGMGGDTSSVDYRIVRPDGTERVVQSLAEKERDGDGTPVRVRGSIADVTDRKRQEERLVRLNRELEGLASTARELSRARDMASVMEIVGRAARMLKGADGAAVILREGDTCFYADEDAIAPLWKGQRFPSSQCISGWVMEHGQSAAVEDVRTDPRVKLDFYEKTFVRSLLVVPVGRPDAIGAIGMYWATPRRTDAEEVRFAQTLADTMVVAIENVQLYADLDRRVLERTAQLEQANREMEAFSYSVSHDLRAPLRAIDGFSSMLDERSGAVLGDEGKRLLGVVRANTRKMSTLIDDLLAFSRVGRSQMRVGRVDMEALARVALVEVVPDIAERSRIAFEIGPLPDARGDASLLRLVWSNVVENAVKFSKGREHPIIRIVGEVDGNLAVYRISDNGVGFDMAYAGKLFGVFQRLHGMNEFEGTGVGLALVHRIVTRHGGDVSAVGAVGDGATFTFSFPAA
jgi:PAS domain S-box-containing protein